VSGRLVTAVVLLVLSVPGCSGRSHLSDKAACAQASASVNRAVSATVQSPDAARKALLAESDSIGRVADRTTNPAVRDAMRREASALKTVASKGWNGHRAAEALVNVWRVAPCSAG
jgi:hypothetical protein